MKIVAYKESTDVYSIWESPEQPPSRTATPAERQQYGINLKELLPSFQVLVASTQFDDGSTQETVTKSIRFPSVVEYEAPNLYTARVVSLPGWVSQGRNPKEAEDNLRDAVLELLAAHRAEGTGFYPEIPEIDFSLNDLVYIDISLNG